jgi:hypothetical protein
MWVCSVSDPACQAHASVACSALPYFSTVNLNGKTFGEKVIEHKMRVLILPASFI